MTVPISLAAWALKHGVTLAALDDLRRMMAPEPPPVEAHNQNESYAQSQVRLEAARAGIHAWRNNVGVLKNKEGRPVRYGLANDSAALNDRIKSSDLIGIKPVLITQSMVGYLIGQFWAREIKRPGWTYRGDEHEEAQQRYITLVQAAGGDACFTTGPGSV